MVFPEPTWVQFIYFIPCDTNNYDFDTVVSSPHTFTYWYQEDGVTWTAAKTDVNRVLKDVNVSDVYEPLAIQLGEGIIAMVLDIQYEGPDLLYRKVFVYGNLSP